MNFVLAHCLRQGFWVNWPCNFKKSYLCFYLLFIYAIIYPFKRKKITSVSANLWYLAKKTNEAYFCKIIFHIYKENYFARKTVHFV